MIRRDEGPCRLRVASVEQREVERGQGRYVAAHPHAVADRRRGGAGNYLFYERVRRRLRYRVVEPVEEQIVVLAVGRVSGHASRAAGLGADADDRSLAQPAYHRRGIVVLRAAAAELSTAARTAAL